MDAQIDVSSARGLLQKLINEDVNGLSLTRLGQSGKWTDGITVTQVEGPTTWRLVYGSDAAAEEQVFTIRGMVTGKDLPPILQRPRVTAGRFRYLRQSVTISGLGTAGFDQAIAAANEIYGVFDRTFPDGQMESWPASSNPGPEGCAAMDASNRYMTPRRDVPNKSHQPFSSNVDPKGILEDMAQESQHIHTEDNVVMYFASHVNESGGRTFVPAVPQSYRIGDIVELQVSYVVVPLKGERYKMLTVLRSIALLDGTFAQLASRNKKLPKVGPSVTKGLLSVKRRVGYEVEAEADEQDGKKGRMEVDESAASLVKGFNTQMYVDIHTYIFMRAQQ